MRLNDVPDCHCIVVEKSVERFKLRLRAHRFRKAAAGVTRQRFADAFEPCAPTSVAKRREIPLGCART